MGVGRLRFRAGPGRPPAAIGLSPIGGPGPAPTLAGIMPTRVFVYGTLRRGESNHHLLAAAVFVRDARTPPGYTLYAFEGHPGMGDGGTDAITGECFDVDDATLAALDALEDHPRWYQRRPLVLDDGETVHAYVLPPHFTRQRAVIPGGDWVRWRRGLA